MSRWFRHYAGMCRDDKLVRASIKSKQSIERVVWVWAAILESAAEIDDAGRYEIDHDEMARFLRCPASKLALIEDSLCALGRLDAGTVAKWSGRQFQSDRSAERTKRYRDRHKGVGDGQSGASRDDVVTSQERRGDAPETETETEYSVAKATGAEAPSVDPEKAFWDDTKAYLRPRVKGDPGALLNRWLKQRGKPLTMAALNACQLERAVDPAAYCEGYFKRHSQNGQPQPVVPL